MKLSEAIRLGAEKRPQCRGSYFDQRYGYNVNFTIHSCVLGAALEGAGLVDPETELRERGHLFDVEWPEFADQFPDQEAVFFCPVCGCGSTLVRDAGDTPTNLAMHLNDDEGWTREAIAIWVESIGY